MPYQPDATDPFSGGEKIPSLSWNQLPVGSTFTCEILEPAKLLQSSEFGTNSLKFWDGEKTRPIMCAVLNVKVLNGPHSRGENRSIWAQIPSNLFVVLKEAQQAAECKFLPGGLLHVRFIGEQPHEKKGFNPIKQYQAKYEPPVQSSTPDPFVNGAPTSQQPITPGTPQGHVARPSAASDGTGTATPRRKW